MNKEIRIRPIAFVQSEIKESSIHHIQLPEGNGIQACIKLLPEYQEGLKDLNGFHYIIVVFHFHLSEKENLISGPSKHREAHGVFATRSPNRPNHIGVSVLKLLDVVDNKVYVDNCDMLDGTPVIDIKPFVPDIDAPESKNSGWLAGIDRSAWKND